MIAHLDCARLCQQVYTTALHRVTIGSVVFAVVGDVIVFRGSATERDWLLDFEAFPIAVPGLGKVERGFAKDMEAVCKWVIRHGPACPVITGHSLGGAHAAILAGLMSAGGKKWDQLVTFGSPRPGFRQLRSVIRQSGRPVTAYRNGADIVPTVPRAILWWGYRSFCDWTRIGAGTDPIMDHLIGNYVRELEK